ncbi:MAG: hypothetical protein HGB03_02980 [Candidatus Yonathbacteria bacterium]|nr:hypothetical protein [Candidatus Yonathbacteria bacterium]NTW47401.1 hypothetical protein [Candidatus Yonathbacteria bacterium]
MNVYEISDQKVRRGAMSTGSKVSALCLGAGKNQKNIPFFHKNPAERIEGPGMPWVGIIMEAHPVPIRDGYALAKPNHESENILVVIRTKAQYSVAGHSNQKCTGAWRFERGMSISREGHNKAIENATGPVDFFVRQDKENIGWYDSLVVMEVGDCITVTDQNGMITRAKYESTKVGLVAV